MPEPLRVYEPNEETPKKLSRAELEHLGKCPTCDTKIEKKANLDEIRKVVMVYKLAMGFDSDDKGWDRIYFSRNLRSAKDLLLFLGSWEKAADCIQDIYEKFTSQGFTVTLETIVKHAGKWKLDNMEREAKRNGI